MPALGTPMEYGALEQDACHSAFEEVPFVTSASCALVEPAALASG